MDTNRYWYSGIHGQIFWVGYGYTQSIPYPWPSLEWGATSRDRNAYAAEHLCWHNGDYSLWCTLCQTASRLGIGVRGSFFFALLYSTMVGRNEEDKLVWLASCSGFFEVKLYYTVLLFDISWVMPKWVVVLLAGWLIRLA